MKNHKYISTKREKIIVEIFALIVIAQQVFIFYPYFKNIEVQPQSQKQVSEDSEVIDITPPLKPKEFISNKYFCNSEIVLAFLNCILDIISSLSFFENLLSGFR